ncbi:MAG: adenosylcobinamide-phosphate synthase CbiB [Hyphomicrobiales bacterium]
MMETVLALIGPRVQPLVAVLLERVIGYPNFRFRLIGHPVTWIGNLISTMDEKLNTTAHLKGLSRLNGVLAMVLLLAAVWFAAACVDVICNSFAFGHLLSALLATTLIAQKSLRDHVRDVGRGLSSSLTEGRLAVSKIVGRDTRGLNVSDVVKAALESLAENTADGVVAPVFWYCVGCLTIGGLPALAIYKAINTADSMIGHKTPQYLHFGWAAARLDDLVNLPASRLTALLFTAAAGFGGLDKAMNTARITWRDARRHRSPNAGWPEAAMAGALGFKFGGPRTYGGEFVKLPYMGEGRDNFLRQDIDAGLKLYDRALLILWILLALFAIIP